MSTAADQHESTTVPSLRPWWQPQLWYGASLGGWLRLLAANRLAVAPRHWHILVSHTIAAASNSLLGRIEQLRYGRQVAATQITESPIFVIGHWRTGTTLLHELLSLDERHSFANSYQCLAPNHFLLTERIMQRWVGIFLPAKRAMDNMAMGWERPQEDEFALCNLGIPSPYATVAFPNHPPQNQEYLDFVGVAQHDLERWKAALVGFLKRLTFRNPKRIVLKSPTHTARLEVLAELFPQAKFIHIVRDPYVVFPSTIHLWKSLYSTQGLQVPTLEGLDEFVFETFSRMHSRLEATRHLVAPSRFYELKYEDLVADPVAQMQRLYDQLELGEFNRVRPAIEDYFRETSDYQTNRYQLRPDTEREISVRWRGYIEQYGYTLRSSEATAAGKSGG